MPITQPLIEIISKFKLWHVQHYLVHPHVKYLHIQNFRHVTGFLRPPYFITFVDNIDNWTRGSTADSFDTALNSTQADWDPTDDTR